MPDERQASDVESVHPTEPDGHLEVEVYPLIKALPLPSPLKNLLNRKFPLLTKGDGHTLSSETREPKYFDMHLHPDLRLQEVIFLDGLLTALSRICDPFIADACIGGRNDFDTLEELYAAILPTFLNEATLQQHLLYVGDEHSKVASGLFFKSGWLPIFKCSAQPAGFKHLKQACADSYSFISSDENVRNGLSNENKAQIALIEKHKLQNFITEEYKNILCGELFLTPVIMQSLAGSFPWMSCSDEESTDSYCRTQAHRVNGRLKLTGRQTGPDAHSVRRLLRESGAEDPDAPLLPRKDDPGPSFGVHTPNTEATIDPNERDRKHAQDVLQQLWTEAVVQDSTFVVLSSGITEYIGIRHRTTQTLYLSSLIKPSESKDPSYLKVRVALCIAAYQDALNRAEQLEDLINSTPLSLPSRFELQIDDQLHAKVERTGLKGLALKQSNKAILDKLKNTSEIFLWLKGFNLAVKPFNSKVWTLSRVCSSKGVGIRRTANTWTVHLDLDKELPGDGIYVAYLRITDQSSDEPSQIFSRPLILKMAWDDDEAEELKREHKNYLQIGSVAGLAKAYGLFSSQIQLHEVRYFLLLEHAGDSFYDIINHPTTAGRGPKKEPEPYSMAYSSKILKAVKCLHKKGWIHNNINLKHLILGKSRQKAALVSLKKSKKPPKDLFKSASKEEIKRLAVILSHADENHGTLEPHQVDDAEDSSPDDEEVSETEDDPFNLT